MIPGLLIQPETAAHNASIEALNLAAFGPGAATRAAARIREQGGHDVDHSLVACLAGDMVGTVRMTPILMGSVPGWLLGPLAVTPQLNGKGIGRLLVRSALEGVSGPVLLVGDPPYYGPLGFKPVPPYALQLPGPVDQHRILVAGLEDADRNSLHGLVRHQALR